MRFAKQLGLSVANVDMTTIDNRRLIVVSRYDRIVDSSGRVERLHQEDFCQATAKPPSKKYQEDGGPSLKQIAEILQLADPAGLEDLLRAVVVNVIIGNGDAHGKNFSLIHDRSGALKLAPLYDLMSTLYYDQNRLAMYIDNVERTDRVTGKHIVNEAVSWGLTREHTSNLINKLLATAPSALNKATHETASLPREIPQIIHNRLEAVKKM